MTVHCRRCHRPFNKYWDQAARSEDDLISIKRSGLCMRCAIQIRVPQGWDPAKLGAQGREEIKQKQREKANR